MWQQQLNERGYAIIPDVLRAGEIAQLTADLSAADLSRTRAGVRHALKSPAVARVANDPRLLELVKSILQDEVVAFRATLFDKSPSSNWLVAWHQDTALPLTERRDVEGWGPWSVKDGVNYAHAPADALSRVLAMRLHLDDSISQNGPLRVLPGSHRMGVLTDAEIEHHAASIAPVECTVAAGGVLAMRPLIIHASSKSKSSAPRRVLHIEYAASLHIHDALRLALA